MFSYSLLWCQKQRAPVEFLTMTLPIFLNVKLDHLEGVIRAYHWVLGIVAVARV